jgi:hypothetical protein
VSAVEIWLRKQDGRRLACYRMGPAGIWKTLKTAAADKALRTGRITLGDITLPAVSHDAIQTRVAPALSEQPGAAAFKAQAAFLKVHSNRIKYVAGGGR